MAARSLFGGIARTVATQPKASVALPGAVRAFSVSAPALLLPRAVKGRNIKRANLERRKATEQLLKQTAQRDPARGHTLTPEGYALWENSDLKSLMLIPEEIWEGKIPPLPKLLEGDAESETMTEVMGKRQMLNYGLTKGDSEFLFQQVPQLMAEDRMHDFPETVGDLADPESADKSQMLSELLQTEQAGAESLSRILDLRNASGKQIERENLRRIVKVFGDGWNVGSSECQAAVITYHMRRLMHHLKKQRKDTIARVRLGHLIHKRAKVLKYLRRKNLAGYYALLPRLGLEPLGVEGPLPMPAMEKVAPRQKHRG